LTIAFTNESNSILGIAGRRTESLNRLLQTSGCVVFVTVTSINLNVCGVCLPDVVSRACYGFDIKITDGGVSSCDAAVATQQIQTAIERGDYTPIMGTGGDVATLTTCSPTTLSPVAETSSVVSGFAAPDFFSGDISTVAEFEEALDAAMKLLFDVPASSSCVVDTSAIQFAVSNSVCTDAFRADQLTGSFCYFFETTISPPPGDQVIPPCAVNEKAQEATKELQDNGFDDVIGPVATIEEVLVPTNSPTQAPTEEPELLRIPDLLNIEGFTTFESLLIDAGLIGTLQNPGPVTVFAPTNAAFNKLPPGVLGCLVFRPEFKELLEELLLYHVAAGEYLTQNLVDGQVIQMLDTNSIVIDVFNPFVRLITINQNSRIVTKNLMASNGVVHGIDDVLFPTGFSLEKLVEECAPLDSIPDLLNKEGFRTFAKALKAAGLIDTNLQETGPFTVFAPTDAAFVLLDVDLLDSRCLLEPSYVEDLTKVLRYHIVEGRKYLASELINVNNGRIQTLEKSKYLTITIQNGVVEIDGYSKIVQPDLVASNGVVHGFDEVLFPTGFNKTAFLESCKEAIDGTFTTPVVFANNE